MLIYFMLWADVSAFRLVVLLTLSVYCVTGCSLQE